MGCLYSRLVLLRLAWDLFPQSCPPPEPAPLLGESEGGREEGGFLCASAVRGASALRLRGHRVFLSLFRGWVGGSEK